MIQVSIIIVTYNTLKLTTACIESIVEWTKEVEYEIIVVDNGSTDGSKDYFEKDKRIKYIYSEKNLGFGRANNLGVSFASGEYVLLLNSDTYLLSNAVYEIYNSLINNSEYSVLGCQLLWPDHQLQQSFFKFPSLFLILLECLSLNLNHPKCFTNNKTKIVSLKDRFISGADLFLSRDLYLKMGGFFPGFFMYYEETDLQYRMVSEGYKIGFIPGVKIVHYNGASQKREDSNVIVKIDKYSRKFNNFNRSRLIYFSRNRPHELFFLKFILTVGIILRYRKIKGHTLELIQNVWKKKM